MPIRQLITISTAHLSPIARAWLSQHSTENHAANYHGIGSGGRISTLAATAFGWFIRVPAAEDCDGIPDDFNPIFHVARVMGCQYILFDADAMELPNLPLFRDDEEG